MSIYSILENGHVLAGQFEVGESIETQWGPRLVVSNVRKVELRFIYRTRPTSRTVFVANQEELAAEKQKIRADFRLADCDVIRASVYSAEYPNGF